MWRSLIRIFDSCIAIRKRLGSLSLVSLQLCPSSVAEHRYMLSNNNQTDQKDETGGLEWDRLEREGMKELYVL
jgi:hypothetical protein